MQLDCGLIHQVSRGGLNENEVGQDQGLSLAGGLGHFSTTWPLFWHREQICRYLHLEGKEAQRPWLNWLQGAWTFWTLDPSWLPDLIIPGNILSVRTLCLRSLM